MPIYEYRCLDCDHTLQLLQRMGASSEGVTCPRCGSVRVERLLSCFASGSAGAAVSQSGCSTGVT
jgi:putative FmdB family regulatory protein